MNNRLRKQASKAAAVIMELFPEVKPDQVGPEGQTFQERAEGHMLGAIDRLEEEFETELGV